MITPKVSDLLGIINKFAPFALAESWDNVGLQVGNPAATVQKVMVALDPERDTLESAISSGCDLLVTHHPFIFTPLKRISYSDTQGSLLAMAIKNDLAMITMHTNYDAADGGMNDLLVELLGIRDAGPLKVSATEELVKLAVFVPHDHEAAVLEELFRFSGFIGRYRDCSFSVQGTGTFTPLEGANPFIGSAGTRESVGESRLEVLLRKEDMPAALKALRAVHPYEEPAFDLYPLLNQGKAHGIGRIGCLEEPLELEAFADRVKERLKLPGLRLVGDPCRPVRKVAVCGGSGASFLRDAMFRGADLLLTGDVKYHDAREAESMGLALIDAGHFGSELPMVAAVADRLRRELAQRSYRAEVVEFQGARDPFIHR